MEKQAAEVVKAFNYTNYELVNKKAPPYPFLKRFREMDGWWPGTTPWVSPEMGVISFTWGMGWFRHSSDAAIERWKWRAGFNPATLFSHPRCLCRKSGYEFLILPFLVYWPTIGIDGNYIFIEPGAERQTQTGLCQWFGHRLWNAGCFLSQVRVRRVASDTWDRRIQGGKVGIRWSTRLDWS